MTQPVLFLDIDGVLNSDAWLGRHHGRRLTLPDHAAEMLDPEAVGRLERIRQATGCRVVVSSSWRHTLPLAEIERLLRRHGFAGQLADRTPAGTSRTSEILAWLAAAGGPSLPHLALEDEPDPGADGFHRVRWLVTATADGLTERDAERAIRALSPPAPPSLGLLVLRTADLAAARAFYELLGLTFAEEQHGDGPVHLAGHLGPLVLELYPGADGHAPDRRTAGATLLGLRVADLDETLARLARAGARVLTPLQLTPHGPRAVVEDPDGRAVELTSLA